MTSHDVVDRVRKIFGVKRVGHAGTLDPIATGVLVIMVGRTTKLSRYLMVQEKEYVFEIEFGKKTDSGDLEGEVIEEISDRAIKLSREEIEKVIPKFLGEIEQVVPMYSAVKVKGRKLYEIARHKAQGTRKKKIERPRRKVTIHELELLEFLPATKTSYPVAKFRVICSKGTYIRTLAEDVGKALGLPAYEKTLCRTRSGKFSLDQAMSLRELEKSKNPSEFLLNPAKI